MPSELQISKKKRTDTRKLPFLPRFGFYLDIGSRELSFKHVPLLETLMNVMEQPAVTVAAFSRVVRRQISEVQFPKVSRQKTINVKARVLSK